MLTNLPCVHRGAAGHLKPWALQQGLQSREAVLLGAVVLLTGILLGQQGAWPAGRTQSGLWGLLQRAALGLAVANGATALILQGCRLWHDAGHFLLLVQ